MKYFTWKVWFFTNIALLILFVVLSPLVFNVLPFVLIPHLEKIWCLFVLSAGLSIAYGLGIDSEPPKNKDEWIFKLMYTFKGNSLPVIDYCSTVEGIKPYIQALNKKEIVYLDISYIKESSKEYQQYIIEQSFSETINSVH